jgi:antitoxin YefM
VIVFVEQVEQDETEYLLSTEANRQHLREAMDRVEKLQNPVIVTPEEWNEKYRL